MSKHQIVRDEKPLTPGELRDWHLMVLAELPKNPNATKVRADLRNKSALGRAYGKFFRERYAVALDFPDADSWVKFYRDVFRKEADLAGLQVPAKPACPCWPTVVVPGLVSNNEAFDTCKKQFGNAWRYTEDLNTVVDIVERPKIPYVVWVKATVEADPDLAGVSAEAIVERKLNTLTLFERLVLELKRFDETKQHLDIENVTLCAGSRFADGYVPCVHWTPFGRELRVGSCGVRGADPGLRARAAVSP